jgi:hypothetical protein
VGEGGMFLPSYLDTRDVFCQVGCDFGET